MARSARQLKLIEIITKNDIETQTELAEALQSEGYQVTQATISRDIKELGLVKTMTKNKTYKYTQPQVKETQTGSKLLNLFKESVVSIDYSANIIVVKTLSGTANSAAALIDRMSIPDILGCVAGDDTVIMVIKGEDPVVDIVDKLTSLLD